jgi:chromosome partitioning protein
LERSELVGIAEISQRAGVTSAAVANWRARDAGFPDPVATLKAGPVFAWPDVRVWLRDRKGISMTANVVAFINLKGGVGKTTTCVATAEMLASEQGKKVLLLDLDPQTNATTMLIGDKRWEQANNAGRTIATLYSDALEADASLRRFDLQQSIIKNAGGIRASYGYQSSGRVDLLPSSLDLIGIQDWLATAPPGPYFLNTPTEILRRAVRSVLDEYDWVLIDCPPNLGLITLSGLRITDGYVIPTIPDYMSTYGIDQITARAAAFAADVGEPIAQPLGIIISKFRDQSGVHQNVLARLRANEAKLHVFNTVIPEKNTLANAAEHAPDQTFRQRYGYDGSFDVYQSIARELGQLLPAPSGAAVP